MTEEQNRLEATNPEVVRVLDKLFPPAPPEVGWDEAQAARLDRLEFQLAKCHVSMELWREWARRPHFGGTEVGELRNSIERLMPVVDLIKEAFAEPEEQRVLRLVDEED